MGTRQKLILIELLMLFVIFATGSSEAFPLGFSDDPVMRVLVEPNQAPFAFVNSQGRPDGYAVDLLRAVARRSHFTFAIATEPSNSIVGKLESGQADILPYVTKPAQKSRLIDFSDTYMVEYDAIFIGKYEDSIRSEDDLHGKTLVISDDGPAASYLRTQWPDAKMIETHSPVEALKFLNSGAASGYVGPKTSTLMAIWQMGLDQIKLAPEPRFGPQTYRYAFAVQKGKHQLLESLNAGLAQVINSGELADLNDRWLSSLDPDTMRRIEARRRLLIIILLASLVAMVLAIFVLIFKREVKRKTETLFESQERFRSLVENLPGAMFRAEHNAVTGWQATYLSDGIEALTGYPASDFLTPRKRTLVSTLHPDDHAALVAARRSGNSCKDRFDFDFRVITRTGETRWMHARLNYLFDEQGKDRFLDGIVIDITEQRRVAELFTEQQSRLASSARLSSLGEMAGGIAHEINNPLAIINLRTHQLVQMADKGEIQSLDVQKVRSIASSIEATSIRISKIVKSLQTVARESEQDPFETVQLKTILADTFELCFQRMRKHGIEVVVDDFPDSLEIECRRVQISQVLINLLNNAFDAVLGQPECFIRISVRDFDPTNVEIAIEDSGPGIPAEIDQKIFQPFFTTKGPGKGTGLGLSISKGMVESHQGEIWLDTSHRRTRFIIRLPRVHGVQTVLHCGPEERTRESESSRGAGFPFVTGETVLH